MIPFYERTLNIDAGPKCTLQCSACARTRFREHGKKIPGKDLTPEQFKKIIGDYNPWKRLCSKIYWYI